MNQTQTQTTRREMTTYEERVHPIHLQSQYGTAARRLDALWHDAARIENYAESLDWQNDEANERAAAAWNVYENERMAALVAAEREAQKSRLVKEAAALADRLHDEWICRRRDGRPVHRYSTAYWNARARLARRREATRTIVVYELA